MKKRLLLTFSIFLSLVAGLRAQTAVQASAVYCDDQSLRFLCGEAVPQAGSRLADGAEVAEVWSGEAVTNTGDVPGWLSRSNAVRKVVFDESFAVARPLSCRYWFHDFYKLEEIEGLGYLNTSWATSMSRMFYNCSRLTALDLRNFRTAGVSDMSGMFEFCTRLESLDLSSFNTARVTNMSRMFAYCYALRAPDLSGFNTAKVTRMDWMFRDCKNMTALDLSALNVANVRNMSNMLQGCESLTTLDLSHFDTSKVTQANRMFDDCPSLRLVDLSAATVPNLSTLVSSIAVRPLIYVPAGTAVPEGRENLIAGDRCAHLVIDYDDATSEQLLLRAPYPFTAERVTLAREFTAGAPHTLCLPFAVGQGTGGTFYNLKAYDEQTARVRFSPMREAETTPHVPYLFIPAADGHVSFGGDIAVSATTDATTEAATADDVTLCGVYARKTFTADESATGCYYGWARGEFRQAGAGARVDACRAYLRLPVRMAGAPARLAVDFGTDGTTGLDAVDTPSIESEKPGYDLGGRRAPKGYRGIVVRQGRKQLQR